MHLFLCNKNRTSQVLCNMFNPKKHAMQVMCDRQSEGIEGNPSRIFNMDNHLKILLILFFKIFFCQISHSCAATKIHSHPSSLTPSFPTLHTTPPLCSSLLLQWRLSPQTIHFPVTLTSHCIPKILSFKPKLSSTSNHQSPNVPLLSAAQSAVDPTIPRATFPTRNTSASSTPLSATANNLQAPQ